MSLYNDYLQQSEKAKFNAQQAALSGDKRLQDFYNSESEQLFIRAMNAKMEEDERRMLEQQRQMQEQQRRLEEQQKEMRVQQYLDQQCSVEYTSDREVNKNGMVTLLPSEVEEYERFKANEEMKERLRREIEEAVEKEQERRANMTPLQRILGSNAFAWIVGSIIMFGGGSLWAMFF